MWYWRSRMLKKGWGSWDDPLARATRGLRRPSLDARSWDYPTHPFKSDSSLRLCSWNGASWGEESVLADSGQAGEIPPGLGG